MLGNPTKYQLTKDLTGGSNPCLIVRDTFDLMHIFFKFTWKTQNRRHFTNAISLIAVPAMILLFHFFPINFQGLENQSKKSFFYDCFLDV